MSAAQPPRDPASWNDGYTTGYEEGRIWAEKECMKR